MSIEALILDRMDRGMLFPILPAARGATVRRALFVNEALHSVLTSPEGDQDWERRVGELQADLEVFVEAPTIGPRHIDEVLAPPRRCDTAEPPPLPDTAGAVVTAWPLPEWAPVTLPLAAASMASTIVV